jgi:replication-associated recombination protein RarA
LEGTELLPFEFFELIDEIKKNTLEPMGYSKIILFCDEANKFSLLQQVELLERFLVLFGSKQVQFLFVASFGKDNQQPEPAIDAFETRMELLGFREKKFVKEMIEKHNDSQIVFTDEAIDIVWNLFQGHPRKTLIVCRAAYGLAETRQLKDVKADLIAEAAREYTSLMDAYRK